MKYLFTLIAVIKGVEQTQEVEIPEWTTWGFQYARNETYHYPEKKPAAADGVTLSKKGYDLIKRAYNEHGILADVRLKVEKKYTEGLTIDYFTENVYGVQMASFSDNLTLGQGNTFEVQLASSVYSKKLNSRRSQALSFRSEKSVSGEELSPLDYKRVLVRARELLLSATWNNDPGDGVDTRFGYSDFTSFVFILVRLKNNLAGQTQSVQFSTNTEAPILDKCFYTFSGAPATITIQNKIKFDSDNWIDVPNIVELVEDGHTFKYVVYDEDNTIKEEVQIPFTIEKKYVGNEFFLSFDLTSEIEIEVDQADSISLQFEDTATAIGTPLFHDIYFYEENSFKIIQQAIYEDTVAGVSLIHEAFSSLASQILDKPDAFYSKIFGRTDLGYSQDGKWSMIAITNGLLLRNAKTDEGDDPDLVLKFKELFETFDKQFPLCLFIEDGRIHIEERIEAYSNNRVELDVSQLTIQPTEYYTSIKAGSENKEYLETDGTLEPIIEREWTTPALSDVEDGRELDLVTPYDFDTTGIEQQRRIQFFDNSDDAKYDENVFVLHIERITQGFQMVTGDPQPITGINSPETLGNIIFTPKRQAHRSWARNSFYKNEHISGKGVNSKNISNLVAGNIAESEPLDPQEMTSPPILPEKYQIMGTVSQNILSIDPTSRFSFIYRGLELSGYIGDLTITDDKIEGSLIRAK